MFSLTLGLAACGSSSSTPLETPSPDPDPTPSVGSVVDVAMEADGFDTLVLALETTGLDTVLDDPDGSFTVFAPTDEAFAYLGDEAIAALLDDPETLSDILLYHVISGNEIDEDGAVAAAGNTVEMANGQFTGLSLSDEGLLVNVSLVVTTNIMADNGIIHVIDAVLMPPAERGEPTQNIAEIASGNDDLSTLVTALETAGLVGALADEDADLTVFAPTNAAFDAVGEELLAAILADEDALEAILLQHVVADAQLSSVDAYAANGTSVVTMSGAEVPVSISGRTLRIGGAAVTIADIYATNGVVHVIDAVIVGDVDLPETGMSLTDVAADNDNFSTLVTALELTGLDIVLDDLSAEFTVFAPTNAAFDALEDGVLEGLLEQPEALAEILLYHVFGGDTVLADAAISIASSGDNIITMANANEDEAALSLSGEYLYVNLSRVITPNVTADNGVIHAVDKVMMPPAMRGEPTQTIAQIAQDSDDFTTLVEALDAANLVGALNDESASFTVFAPTDAAFAAIDSEVLEAILADPAVLEALLGQHVIEEAQVNSIAAYAANGTNVTTMSGAEIPVSISGGNLHIGGATVTMVDLYATNGIIHVIDAVIVGDLELPEPAEPQVSLADLVAGDERFTTLLAALDATGLDETLANLEAEFTVFAPTNDAFDALEDGVLDGLLADPEALEAVLLYHVFGDNTVLSEAAVAIADSEENVIEMASGGNAALSLSGEALYINLSQVIDADLTADNGVAHAIDKVMMPQEMPEEAPTMNIVETAIDAGIFETLVSALVDTNLDGALADEDETYTVFAPTDDAFAALPDGTLESLSEEQLTQILLNHVISGAAVDSVTAFSLNGGAATTMATDGSVSIAIVDGELQIGGATVSMFDIYTTNGIIHVIDSVILD
ncbi:fasciclin domain-containing protein [Marinimicrobium alkaliphilum]|uniref:fasciclin domain-containing protein n=1 Tax=Marinimicrobium alkaliphilum TaxID=2202654 RepID=UPI001E39BF70|nr:fasciclin domain-containing protein [Marinimicrobium alkaliphilum]